MTLPVALSMRTFETYLLLRVGGFRVPRIGGRGDASKAVRLEGFADRTPWRTTRR